MKINLAIIFLCALGAFSCKSSESSYSFNKFNNVQFSDSALVTGTVKNTQKEVLYNAAIKINGKKVYRAAKNGNIAFSILPGKYHFTGLWIHYKPLKTKEFKVSAGDSIRIIFYLEQGVSLYEKNLP